MLKRLIFSKLKRKPLKRTSLNRYKKIADHEEIEKMQAFFLSIWKSRSHYCVICGAYLGSEPHSYNFDHLLEKQSHPELKYEKRNIELLCLDCHGSKSMSFYPGSYAKKIQKTKKLFGVE